MILFVAQACWDHEGCDVIGVFDQRILAEKALERHHYKDGVFRGDYREIVEFPLNEDTWEGLI